MVCDAVCFISGGGNGIRWMDGWKNGWMERGRRRKEERDACMYAYIHSHTHAYSYLDNRLGAANRSRDHRKA